MNIGQDLKTLIVSTVWEIYANAFEHGKTDIGVFSCGQHFPKLNKLQLTVVDFGIGIPHNVRDFLEKADFAADKALKWAFKAGTTTRRGEARGIGLDLLRNFVKKNKGKLEIFSHDGYAILNESQEEYKIRENFFEGTLVNITLLCDESYYSLYPLLSESDNEPLF
ncbi:MULTISPECIES: ATP-binding protein [Spirulina sp. CCY15215]|uniref:ATP-binding protein n=1 Tax=Spirulina sp. CCY15215 TaxID=2767591 RepID=UPI00194FC24F